MGAKIILRFDETTTSFDDKENSTRYGNQVNMERVTEPLDALHTLSGIYDLVVEEA